MKMQYHSVEIKVFYPHLFIIQILSNHCRCFHELFSEKSKFLAFPHSAQFEHKVWKFSNFPATLILREMNFG